MVWLLRWLDDTSNKLGLDFPFGNNSKKNTEKNKTKNKKSTNKNKSHSGFEKSAKQRAQRVQRAKARASKSKKGPSRVSPYRAVSIHPTGQACDAAHRIKEQRFLATFAPQLPLGGCKNPQQCGCRYKYHQDRRVALRRDSDHGLPAGAYHKSERRYRRDRRGRTVGSQAAINH